MTTLNLAYYQNQLSLINATIAKILEGGQDLSLSDKRVIYARLSNLHDERARIEKIIAALEGGGPIVRNYGIRKR